ncbi:MAG: PorT family protein [Bacteroidales bacterium]|nr:PorT family protein [Bacteroidales bacterium]
MRKRAIAILLTAFCAVALPPHVHAKGLWDSIDVRIRMGYSIGGTVPLDMPTSIRSLDAFRPTPSPMAGADATVWVSPRLGFAAGLHIENKGMDAEVTVKSYRMEMRQGGSQMAGLFTGHVKQEVTQWMVTLPVQAIASLGKVLTLKAGPYFSFLISKGFSGIAFDGYLRQGNPTGPKITIGDEEGEWATYDFRDSMRSLQWGIAAGVDWCFSRHLGLSVDLGWGLSGVFQSDFETVEQTLYPIYGTLGLLYRF